MAMCLCVLWYFPNSYALKFEVVSIYLSEELWKLDTSGGGLRFLVSAVYVD